MVCIDESADSNGRETIREERRECKFPNKIHHTISEPTTNHQSPTTTSIFSPKSSEINQFISLSLNRAKD
ncbi:hypothetical protein P8452_23672 [Trifolium repens]|nr:hypothetical protein P8452_23672 [Trifolium repens]